MINLFHNKSPSSILGISLEEHSFSAALVNRRNNGLHVEESLKTTLSLDPLTDDPELVGREIKNHLDRTHIREHTCVCAVPMGWVFTSTVDLAGIPEDDIPGFIELEAERAFPYNISDIVYSISKYRLGDIHHATLTGIPRSHLDTLEIILHHAKLRPVSFRLGVTAFNRITTPDNDTEIAMLLGNETIGMAASGGGGIILLRYLKEAYYSESGNTEIDPEYIYRELRIATGQLPILPPASTHPIRIIGTQQEYESITNALAPVIGKLGWRFEHLREVNTVHGNLKLPTQGSCAAAAAAAAATLCGGPAAFEYLPPRIEPWRKLVNRIGSGKTFYLGGTAAVIILITALLFLWQNWKLSNLESKWGRMEPSVTSLESMQQNIRKYRTWFDDSFPNLRLLEQLTQAFPEDGVVTAKDLEVVDLNGVFCNGVSRDNGELLAMIDRLRAAPEIADLKVEQVRGTSPQQFIFNYRWTGGFTYEE